MIELPTDKTTMQQVFESSRVNGAPYEEPVTMTRWSWPQSTWMRRRLARLHRAEFTAEVTERTEG